MWARQKPNLRQISCRQISCRVGRFSCRQIFLSAHIIGTLQDFTGQILVGEIAYSFIGQYQSHRTL